MLLFARKNPDKKFLVTKIGSSLAGYKIDEIRGLFEKLKKIIPDNVILPKEYEVRDAQFIEANQPTQSETTQSNVPQHIIDKFNKYKKELMDFWQLDEDKAFYFFTSLPEKDQDYQIKNCLK